MKILKGRVNWVDGYANDPRLEVLVDKMPDSKDLRYEERSGLYYAEFSGYASFYYYVSPGEGFGGRIFNITMKNGTEKFLKGPWSSRAGIANKLGFGPCLDVSMTNNSNSYERGYTFFASACTLKLVMDALDRIDVGLGYGFKKGRWSNVEEFPFPKGSKFHLEEYDDGSDIVYIPVAMFPDGEIWMKNPKRQQKISSYRNDGSSGDQFNAIMR